MFTRLQCDGIRPRCTRCRDNDLACQYDVAEGVSRAERMKLLKRDSMSSRVEEMERVMNVLRSGSDIQASTLLARLRLGERMEDVAKSLPPTTSTMFVSNPPRYANGRFPIRLVCHSLMTCSLSLQAQDSAGTSNSGVSQESGYMLNDTAGAPLLQHDSGASHASSSIHHPNWAAAPSSTATSLRSAGKRRQSTAPSGELTEDCQFLSLLFDRQDYLLPGSDSEDEDNSDAEFDKTLDPRLLFEGGKRPIESPMDMSVSRLSSPEKGENVRSIHVTHLRSRQPIVNTIRIHPNINLRNLFGNLPFSSSIRANNYPEDVQDTQVNNLFLPTWAMMTVSTRPDPGSVRTAFPSILQEATALLESGTPVEVVVEVHPNIAALFNENDFNASGLLSRWAAGMVHSVMLKGAYCRSTACRFMYLEEETKSKVRTGNDFTCFAYMHLFWYLMRWMIYPSPETYEMIPEWLRPT